MVRQYIGARYVPKFYENSAGTSEWRSGVIYEPLTIVTWNGNSYTSKKAVPAEIGDPSSNPSYWVATGNYNQQVEDYRQEVLSLRSDVDDGFSRVNTLIGENDTDSFAVFIGDSYAYGNTIDDPAQTFPRLICAKLGVTCKNFATGGSGFIYGNTVNIDFNNQLQNAIADDTFDNDKVSYVIISGGRNDATNLENQPYFDIYTAVTTLLTNAENAFPNAKIIVVPMLYDANILPRPGYTWYCQLMKAALGTGHKAVWVKNAYAWLCGKFGCINQDGIHPNVEGHLMISSCILDVIFGGDGFLNVDRTVFAHTNAKVTDEHIGMTNTQEHYQIFGTFTTTDTLSRGEGICGSQFAGYNNIPCYLGNQKLYCTIYRTDNNNTGRYQAAVEFNTTTKALLLRCLEDMPAASYQFYIEAPFGRYGNAVTG